MASVRVAGRFPAGAVVALVAVEGPGALRSEGGSTVARARVDTEGAVQFDGLEAEVGSSYFVTGYRDGQPVEVRAVSVDDPADAVSAQLPVQGDPTVLSDGTVLEPDGPVADGELDGDLRDLDAEQAADQDEAPASDVAPLTGKALKDRASELEIAGRGSMSADDLRAAVAAKEAETA